MVILQCLISLLECQHFPMGVTSVAFYQLVPYHVSSTNIKYLKCFWGRGCKFPSYYLLLMPQTPMSQLQPLKCLYIT